MNIHTFFESIFNKWKYIRKFKTIDCDIINYIEYLTYTVGKIRAFQAPLSEDLLNYQYAPPFNVYINAEGIVFKLIKYNGNFYFPELKQLYSIVNKTDDLYFIYKNSLSDKESIWKLDKVASHIQNLEIHSIYGYGLFVGY